MKRIINKTVATILTAVFTVLFSATIAQSANVPFEDIQTSLGNLISKKLSGNRVSGEQIRTKPFIRRYYEERNFDPIWSNGSTPGNQVKSLVKALDRAGEEGLSPEMYHRNQIVTILEEGLKNSDDKETALANLEILSTDAFLSYASHLHSGFLNPVSRRPSWFSKNSAPVITGALDNAARSKNVEKILFDLLPKSSDYEALKKSLVYYREEEAKGGWSKVAGGKKIEPGAQGPRILAIRKRLTATDELGIGPVEVENYYDDELVKAVEKFQVKHGLNPDGVVGRGTVNAMNTTPTKRITQIVRSMDTLRSLSHLKNLDKYVLVNVPGYRLQVMERGKEVMNMKVVVGRADRRTPLLSNSIKYIVFSPKWYVPTSIAVKDKLPKIHKDPNYIKRQGMKVFAKDENGTREVDPSEIDWTEVNKENFNYRFVQRPSTGNALGTVKFMFPNRHSVYLHDTPTKYLFKRDLRPYSSGCIRIEKPVEFAKYLLKDKPEWTPEKIKANMGRGQQRFVHLKEHVPVRLVYMTAWADENGETKVIKDVYNYDHPLDKYY